MKVNQIKEIISAGETQEVEFKESFHRNQDISKILCGLANTFGGLLIFGVKDNGVITGIKGNLDKIQQQISASNQTVSPAPLISIEIHKLENKDIIVAIIQRPSDNVYYTFQGAIHVRIGSITKRLDGQTQLEFLRGKQILSFDESYESTAKIEDIDNEKIKKYLTLRKQENFFKEHSIEDFLISNKLASKNDGLKIQYLSIRRLN